MFKGVSLVSAFALVCFVFTMPSCTKEDTYNATITVVDTLNQALSGASVHLYFSGSTTGQTQLDSTITTDGSGVAHFTFKLEATWDIDATYNGVSGTGLVTLKKNEDVAKTVIVPTQK